jgi:hypothetical protein
MQTPYSKTVVSSNELARRAAVRFRVYGGIVKRVGW